MTEDIIPESAFQGVNSPLKSNIEQLLERQKNLPKLQRYKKAERTKIKNFLVKNFDKINSHHSEKSDALALVIAGDFEISDLLVGVHPLVRTKFLTDTIRQLPEGYINKPYLRTWGTTARFTKQVYYTTAATEGSSNVYTFTLDLTEITQQEIKHRDTLITKTETPAQLMNRRITSQLNKLGIDNPLLWFVIEYDEKLQPHLHGVIDLQGWTTRRRMDRVRVALKAAGGATPDWIEYNRAFYNSKMLQFKHLNKQGIEGRRRWSAYSIEQSKLTGREFICKEWRVHGKALYEQIRDVINDTTKQHRTL